MKDLETKWVIFTKFQFTSQVEENLIKLPVRYKWMATLTNVNEFNDLDHTSLWYDN